MGSVLKQRELKENEELVLELKDGRTITGKFLSYFADGTAVELINCKDYHNNNSLGSKKRFYEKNIKSVKYLTSNGKESEFDSQIIQMTNDQRCHIECTNYNYKLIGQADCNFHDAVKDLSVQPAVAVYSVGTVDNCPHGRITQLQGLLCLATQEAIYLFDALQWKEFRDLKKIFNDKNIVKVMYNSNGLCDNLKQRYDIDVETVFDIFVCDSFVSKEIDHPDINQSSSLEDCIFKNLNVDIKNAEKLIWNARPLTSQHLLYGAKRCGYLLFLYNHIIRKKFLNKFLNMKS